MNRDATPADVLAGRARWSLVHGDNRDVLPTLPAKSVAHVITDPPYEIDAHTKGRRMLFDGSNARTEEAPLSFDAITEEGRRWFAVESTRISDGWILAFCQIEAVGRWRERFEEAGAKWRRGCVWVKGGMPQLTGDRPAAGCEAAALAWTGRGRSVWNGGGRAGVWTHGHQGDGPLARVHETQKPVALMIQLVELFADPDDIVLDPFAGSGTTGVACLRLGRRFIGIEKDAAYAQVARDRLAAEADGLSLCDARAGQQPLFPGGA